MTDDEEKQDASASDQPEALLFAEFLEAVPPNVERTVTDVRSVDARGFGKVKTPDIQLHCESQHCRGTRFFAHIGSELSFPEGQPIRAFLKYRCRNCNRSHKIYAVSMFRPAGDKADPRHAVAVKFGELPVFGPPTPARLVSLVGEDRDAFLKGRRAENLGLGIGAFAYYRRVVENQKDRLLDEILRVAVKLNAKPDVLAALEAAKKENQFSKAVDLAKDAIPETLRIQGHNPLTLLHKAPSEGLTRSPMRIASRSRRAFAWSCKSCPSDQLQPSRTTQSSRPQSRDYSIGSGCL